MSSDLFSIETENINKVSVTYKTNTTKQKLFLERLNSTSNLYNLLFYREIKINQSDTIFIKTATKNYTITNFRFSEMESHGNPCLFEYEINGLNTSQDFIVIKNSL